MNGLSQTKGMLISMAKRKTNLFIHFLYEKHTTIRTATAMPARITTTIGRTTFPVLTVGEESVSELNTEGKFTRMREVSMGFTLVLTSLTCY